MAAVAAQYPVRLTTDCVAGISRREQQADLASDRQVIEIVTDEAGALGGDAQVVLQLRQCFRFVFDAHQTVLDAQLLCPDLGGTTLAATEKGECETRLLQESDSQSVAHIEALLELALRTEPEAAVGEHAVHVEHQEFEGSELLPDAPPLPGTPWPGHASPA